MKAKNANAGPCHGVALLKGFIILLAAGTIFFSCKKNADAIAPSNDNMDNIAKIIDGNALEGSIAKNSDENGMAIVFNRGSKYVLIEKIPGMPSGDVSSIQSAVLITSKYGVIVKDITNNKVWLLANNDEESLQKFELIKQQLHSSYVSITIFGTTIINAERS